MKSPTDISQRLNKQWKNSDLRVKRLLSADAWPVQLPIGFPNAQQFVNEPATIREHITQWRKITTGQVIWNEKKYIASSEPVALPKTWLINNPSDWIAATDNKSLLQEFKLLEYIVSEVDPVFHHFIIRKRHLILSKNPEDVIKATHICTKLEPNSAHEKPLRALSVENCDSKFFERHRHLITKLLDVKFDNAVSDIGLEKFLGASDDSDHWLLIVPLDSRLLPYEQLRIRASELEKNELPAAQIIIVENEQCLHQLPKLNNTIAILGAGLNLTWLKATWFKKKKLAYWGDMDTWGLSMLADARSKQPHLTAMLMKQSIFDNHIHTLAVIEPQTAGDQSPLSLSNEEKDFYQTLRSSTKGRLEQEFLPENEVRKAFLVWHDRDGGERNSLKPS